MRIQQGTLLAVSFILTCLVSLDAFAETPSAFPSSTPSAIPAGPDSDEFTGIPTQPNAPKPVLKPREVATFKCDRLFVYRGKTLDCDSFVRRDAENLRPIIGNVPEAVAELDAYQSGRRNLQTVAYITSLGLVTALVGFFIHHPPIDNGVITTGGWVMMSGLSVSIVSYTYGLSAMKANENHIENAIDRYNAAKPDDPIKLQFTTGFSF